MAFDDAARFFQRYQYTPLFEPCQVLLSKKFDDYQQFKSEKITFAVNDTFQFIDVNASEGDDNAVIS